MNYFKLAEQIAELSNCNKRKVGAVGVGEGFYIASYNYHDDDCDCTGVKGEHSNNVIHAESGLLINAVRIICTTYQPCLDCARNIVWETNCKKLYYRDAKPEDTSGIDYLRGCGVDVYNEWNV